MKLRNRDKPLLIVGIGIIGFILFFVLLTQCQNKFNEAKGKLNKVTTYEKTKEIWNTYEVDLSSNPRWSKAVQDKLAGLLLNEQQVNDLSSWFKVEPKIYLNLIVLPDLSGRLKVQGQPLTVENDKIVLDYIWQAFEQSILTKQNQYKQIQAKDKLKVEVTRDRESDFGDLANKMRFDLSETPKSNQYLKQKYPIFRNGIDELYRIGTGKTVGADYYSYIRNELKEKTAKSSPFIKYRNLIIILTDGYLELTEPRKIYYTGSPEELKTIRSGRKKGLDWQTLLGKRKLLIQNNPHAADLREWEFLIVQAQERKDGPGDFEILEKLWTDWLVDMSVPIQNITFRKYQLASGNNKSTVADFFKVDAAKITDHLSADTQSSNKIPSQESSTKSTTQYDSLLTDAENAINQNGNPGKVVISAPTAPKKNPNEVRRMSKVTSTVVRDSFLKQIEGELEDCDFDQAAASFNRFKQQHPEWRDDALVFRYGRQLRSIEMESRKLKSWKTSPNRQAETKRSYEVLCKLRPACFSNDYFAYLVENGLTKQQN